MVEVSFIVSVEVATTVPDVEPVRTEIVYVSGPSVVASAMAGIEKDPAFALIEKLPLVMETSDVGALTVQ